MMTYRKELWFHLPKRRGLINITESVQEAVNESGIREGLVLVNAMNISASVFINAVEKGLHADFETWLEKLAPELPYEQYKHNTEADCWIAVHQKVWDITDFVAEHPGGSAGELSPSSGEMRTRKPHSKERIMRGAEAEEGIV